MAADKEGKQERAKNVRLIGRWPYGEVRAVAVKDNISLLNSGSVIYVLDVSRPSSPVRLAELTMPGLISDFFVSGSWAYVADYRGGLRVINISDPSSPKEVGHYDIPGNPKFLHVSGSYAYLTDGDLRVIDISDRSNPKEVGHYTTPGNSHDIHLSGSYAYIADGDSGLLVLDISDPLRLKEMGRSYIPQAYRLDIAGSHVYVACFREGFRVIDVSDPTHPREVGYYDTPGRTDDVHVDGSYAYLAVVKRRPRKELKWEDMRRGVTALDISDPSNPKEVGHYSTVGDIHDVCVSGSYVYAADWSRGKLRVIEISFPEDLREVGHYEPLHGGGRRLYVSDRYAYVADWGDLRVLDVSSPSIPSEVGHYDTPGFAHDVFASGSHAYVADGRKDGESSSLLVIDLSSPSNPTAVGRYRLGGEEAVGNAWEVYVSGSYAFVTGDPWLESHGSLWIIDVSDPSNPNEAGYYETSDLTPLGDIQVSGSYAYVKSVCADRPEQYYDCLRILNVSNANDVQEVGQFTFPIERMYWGATGDVWVSGRYAYVVGFPDDESESSFWVLDVSNPSNPEELGQLSIPPIPRSVVVSGSLAYVADWWGGIRVIDVSSP
ncbi:MAG: LVIVD repeat-containing protein, partial [bacterium]